MDKEYIVLNAIEQNPNVTQRELSSKAQISLGSVNLLINKMVKEGLVKINQIPMNRVAYMLTPKGIVEKINKTSAYIKHHYNYINETKEKIHEQVMKLSLKHRELYIILEDDEISELITLATSDIKGIQYIERKTKENVMSMEDIEALDKQKEDIIMIVTTLNSFNNLKSYMAVVNLLELI